MGGANVIDQSLAARLVDELRIHLSPLTLGGGTRLFELVGPTRLIQREVIESPRGCPPHVRGRQGLTIARFWAVTAGRDHWLALGGGADDDLADVDIGGCSIANATARAIASGGIANLVEVGDLGGRRSGWRFPDAFGVGEAGAGHGHPQLRPASSPPTLGHHPDRGLGRRIDRLPGNDR